MREAVFNGAGLEEKFANAGDALESLDDVATGLIALRSRKIIRDHFWTRKSFSEIEVCEGISLRDLIVELFRKNRNKGSFMLRMLEKCPIDDAVGDDDLRAYLDWEIENLPGHIDLLLCAISDAKIAVSLSPDEKWHRNPLELKVGIVGNYSVKKVENVHSLDSAHATIERISSSILEGIQPTDFWDRRAELYPDLLFGQDVEAHIGRIGSHIFKSALSKLSLLNHASASWAKSKSPHASYPIKVSPESGATMAKYGYEREFRASTGKKETFEKHVYLPDGHRLHLREITDRYRIEIGYIGPHLRIVSIN